MHTQAMHRGVRAEVTEEWVSDRGWRLAARCVRCGQRKLQSKGKRASREGHRASTVGELMAGSFRHASGKNAEVWSRSAA
jgi:hypothetical protein